METIRWWQSRTIWATVVSGLCSLLALSGHVVDANTQTQISTALMDIVNGVAVISAFVGTYYRLKASKPITPPVVPPAIDPTVKTE